MNESIKLWTQSLIIIITIICVSALWISYIGYEIDIRIDDNSLEALKLGLNCTK